MKRLYLCSQIFNLFFYVLTAIACVLCLPTLFLPRRYFMAVVLGFVHTVYFLERLFLGLDYEVRGAQNLPASGSFIVAAKHQSPYETMKLHLLFKDPAIILKKELLSIPLWGMYLKKSDVIAIDRSSPELAIKSIQDGARRMAAQGRPIVIFPQGTRVHVTDTPKHKPYKVGVARIQEATGLPVIPLALNTGLFWPRSGWLKSAGTVIFEFLEPIKPGVERVELMKALEQNIESASISLANEAREKSASGGGALMAVMMSITIVILAAFAGYSAYWTSIAEHIRAEYPRLLKDMVDSPTEIARPSVTGYPGKIRFYVPEETLKNAQGSVTFKDVQAESWPVPGAIIEFKTGAIEIRNRQWPTHLNFDLMSAKFKMIDEKQVNIAESALQMGTFKASITGQIDLRQEPFPLLDLTLTLDDHQALLQELAIKGIIETRVALFMNAGLSALANGQGVVTVPLKQKDNALYAGPLLVMNLPKLRPSAADVSRETAAPPAPSP